MPRRSPPKPSWTHLLAAVVLTLSFAPNHPASAQVQWQSIGPGGGGWLTVMAINPVNPNILYVGCDVGGVYRSLNGGQTWSIINNGLIHYSIDDILIDRSNPSRIFLASDGGVYRSDDAGGTWVLKRNGFAPRDSLQITEPIACLTQHTVDPATVYACVGQRRYYQPGTDGIGKIYITHDSGESWSVLNSGLDIPTNAYFFSLVPEPANPLTLFAATNLGLYKSTDGGFRWIKKAAGLPYDHVRQLVIDPTNTQIMYLSVWYDDTTGANQSGVYKSTDGGNSWFAVNTGLGRAPSDIYWHLVMAPDDPQTLYVGNVWGADGHRGVYKTSNGGATWIRTTLNDGSINVGWLTQWDFDVTFVAVAPSPPGTVYFGSSAMLGKTTDGGATWQQIYTTEISPGYWRGTGLETTEVTTVAVDPQDPNRLLCGFIDTGLLLSPDNGQSFHRIFKPDYPNGDDVFSITFDPDVPGTVYLTDGEQSTTGNFGNVLRSTDRGTSWTVLSTRIPYAGLPYGRYLAFAIDRASPTASRTLYTACIREVAETPDGGVFKSVDGGTSWASASVGLGNLNEHVASLAIDPTNPQRLYAAVPVWWYYGTGGFFKSDNGAATWRRTAPNLQSVWKVVVDPVTPGVVYAGTSSDFAGGAKGGVFKSVDYGETFVEASVGLDNGSRFVVRDLGVSPYDSRILFVGTGGAPGDVPGNRGVYRSSDGAASWAQVNSGLTTMTTMSLSIDPFTPGRVFLGTEGNGLFVTWNALSGVADAVLPDPRRVLLLRSFPNPFNPATTIEFELSAPMTARISIYDTGGRLVTTLADGWYDAGRHSVHWDGRDARGRSMASGSYFYRLNAGSTVQSQKLTLVR